MSNKHSPFQGLDISILTLIPIKGRRLLGIWVMTHFELTYVGFGYRALQDHTVFDSGSDHLWGFPEVTTTQHREGRTQKPHSLYYLGSAWMMTAHKENGASVGFLLQGFRG